VGEGREGGQEKKTRSARRRAEHKPGGGTYPQLGVGGGEKKVGRVAREDPCQLRGRENRGESTTSGFSGSLEGGLRPEKQTDANRILVTKRTMEERAVSEGEKARVKE